MKYQNLLTTGFLCTGALFNLSSCINIAQLNQTEQKSSLGELPLSPSTTRFDSVYSIPKADSLFCDVPFDLFLSESSEEELHIDGPENYVKAIIVDTTGNSIRISANKEFKIMAQHPCKIYFSCCNLSYLDLMNNGDASVLGYQSNKDLCLNVSGCGNFTCKTLTCPNLRVNIPGTGNISIQKANVEQKFSCEIEGSGNVHVSNLETKEAVGDISGAGALTMQGMAQSAHLIVSGMGAIDISNFEVPQKHLVTSLTGLGNIKGVPEQTSENE